MVQEKPQKKRIKRIMGVIKPLWEWLQVKRRGSVLYGGRGGGKSWHIALYLVLESLRENHRVLCCREIQNSIKDSVHKLLSDCIYSLGLEGRFNITKDSIISETGSEFIFKGLRHSVAEIKSTEGVSICWVEEAQSVSAESWEILLPTIRKEGSRFFVSFNPHEADDPVYERFVKGSEPGWECYKINYTENPFISDELLKQAEYLKEANYETYLNIWGGEVRKNTEALVFAGKYEIKDFEIPTKEQVDRFFVGCDWGFSNDPTACISCFIKDGNLYICREGYGIGVDFPDIPSKIFVPVKETLDGWPIMADCARPETISYLNSRSFDIPLGGKIVRKSFRVEAAKKWKGSVEDGIEYLKSFRKIYIHPNCVHTAEEFRNYSYEVDKKTGQVLPKIKGGWDHCIDATRYALDGYITDPDLDWLKYV